MNLVNDVNTKFKLITTTVLNQMKTPGFSSNNKTFQLERSGSWRRETFLCIFKLIISQSSVVDWIKIHFLEASSIGGPQIHKIVKNELYGETLAAVGCCLIPVNAIWLLSMRGVKWQNIKSSMPKDKKKKTWIPKITILKFVEGVAKSHTESAG